MDLIGRMRRGGRVTRDNPIGNVKRNMGNGCLASVQETPREIAVVVKSAIECHH